MLRYVAIATVIVLTIVVLVTSGGRILLPIHVAPTNVPMPPKEGRAARASGATVPFRGTAPWALSALPDCLIQRSESRGTPAYVRSKLPAGMLQVPEGSTLTYGPCTIFLRDGEVIVTRGQDRLRIPPRVRLYRKAGVLALLRTNRRSAELRVYTPPRKRM
jgi:hypothetical protein